MSVVTLLVFLLVLIAAFYLAGLIPDASGQKLARVVIVVVAILWALSLLGVFSGGTLHVR